MTTTMREQDGALLGRDVNELLQLVLFGMDDFYFMLEMLASHRSVSKTIKKNHHLLHEPATFKTRSNERTRIGTLYVFGTLSYFSENRGRGCTV